MVRCPNCLKEAPDKKFCEHCGTPLKSQVGKTPAPQSTAPAPTHPGAQQTAPAPTYQAPVAGRSGTEMECPICRQIYPGDAKYCKDCRYEGKPVSLVEKGSVPSIKIRFIDIATGKSLDFSTTNMKQFGRADFIQWYQNEGLLTKDEWSHISKKHFKIEKSPKNRYTISDTMSGNGTHLNGNTLIPAEPIELGKGSEIGLPVGGKKILKFRVEIT